jgi:hypothetical protein
MGIFTLMVVPLPDAFPSNALPPAWRSRIPAVHNGRQSRPVKPDAVIADFEVSAPACGFSRTLACVAWACWAILPILQ